MLVRMVVVVVVVAAGCLLAAGQAHAGMLSLTPHALDDGSGPDGGVWRGTISAYKVNPFFPILPDTADADVDFAVFGKGLDGDNDSAFQNFLDDNSISFADPANGAEFIYAYQYSAVRTAIPGIAYLKVGIQVDDPRGTVGPDPDYVPATSVPGTVVEPEPGKAKDGGTSMSWGFDVFSLGPNHLGAGQQSTILFFSSPVGPEVDFGEVNSGTASFSENAFPSPIPEPSSLLLLGVVAVLRSFSGRIRSRRTAGGVVK